MTPIDPARVLAFRLARSGLVARAAPDLAAAAACPASDFSRDAALLALAARAEGVTREGYERAVDAGDLVVAHAIRGAIHALAPSDHALLGPALLASDEEELGVQLGRQVRRLCAETGIAPTDAPRARVRDELMPWCRGCGSHHVAPMLWRYATVAAGVRLDARRRYVPGRPGRPPPARRIVHRFLSAYGPGTPAELADWAGLARSHAGRLWDEVADELERVDLGRRPTWMLREDRELLESPPAAAGVRLLPPGDPVLQPTRPLLVPDDGLRRRLFRPVASPGAVLCDGRLGGLWRVKGTARRTEITVEPIALLPRAALQDEARRVADLRGAGDLRLVVG